MHTYYSALPFTPHNTRLYRLYERETSQSITILQGIDPTWTSCLSSLSLGKSCGGTLTISPDGTQFAVSEFARISILDARTTAPQCKITLTYNVQHLAFSPCESTLATINSNHLDLWNAMTGINQETQRLRSSEVHAMAFSSRGQYLLLSIDRSLHLHHGTDASELSVLSTKWRHENIIFSCDDTQVITGTQEGQIHFFTLSGNGLSEIPEKRISNETAVRHMVLRRDCRRLATVGADKMIRIYDLPSRSPIATLSESGINIWTIAYHPTEEELAVGNDRYVVLWRQKETPSDWVASIHSDHRERITAIAYCENGTRMYTCVWNGAVKLWATTTTTTTTRDQEQHRHTDVVTSLAVNRPASLLATGGYEMSIILWKLTTGDYWKTLLGHTGSITSLIFSDDGVLLASGSSDGTARVWDVASGSLLHKLEEYKGCENVVAFSEDNAQLTTEPFHDDFGGELKWELKSGELLERQRTRVNKARTRGNYLEQAKNRWQTVVGDEEEKWKYLLCRPPGEYWIYPSHKSIIFGDRAVLPCVDGRVLILDISRVVMHKNPIQQTSPAGLDDVDWRVVV
jgi:WD40 repeat protein